MPRHANLICRDYTEDEILRSGPLPWKTPEGWIVPVESTGCFLADKRLVSGVHDILITYVDNRGKRRVTKCRCSYGRVPPRINGDVVAWMPMPEPYKGQRRKNLC